MAEILGLGCSHAAMILNPPEEWVNMRKGIYSPVAGYRAPPAMVQELGDDEGLTHDKKNQKRITDAFEVLRKKLHDWKPDVVMIVGDDQAENFKRENLPTFCLYTGSQADSYPFHRPLGHINLWNAAPETKFTYNCPMEGVGLPDYESAEPNPLSIEEQRRVNELEMNLRDSCIWHLEYGHGWRPVSCEGLTADDVLEAVQRADGFILRTQKRRAGKLTTTRAPILPETLSLLEELVNVLQLRGKVAVFWGRRSEPLGEEGLYKAVKRLYERAGVRVRTKEDRNGHIPYDLRDTFANTVEEAVGPGGRGVAERLMGHESGKSIELYLVNRQPQELATYSPLRRMVCGKGDGLWNSPSQKQNSPAKKTEENSSLELVETGESRTPRPNEVQ